MHPSSVLELNTIHAFHTCEIAAAFLVSQDFGTRIDPQLDHERFRVTVQRVVEHSAGRDGPVRAK